MTTVTVSLPGLTEAEARTLINNALWDWRFRRPVDTYVEERYSHMDPGFRIRRQALFNRQLAALDQCETDILNF